MVANKQTVLCAAVSADMKALKARDKRAAVSGIADCLELLRAIAESSAGHSVKTVADRLIVLFATPDAAAGAASKMHAVMDGMPPFAGAKLGVRIAFHSGPTNALRNDDTVRLVLRLVARAQSGQTLTSQHTAELLSTSFRIFSRHLQAFRLRRRGTQNEIYEIS